MPVAQTQPPEVRTVVETRTIHRTKHVKAKVPHVARQAASAAPATPGAQRVAAPVVRAAAPAPAPRPVAPVRSRTSGASAGAHDDDSGDDGHEGGSDD